MKMTTIHKLKLHVIRHHWSCNRNAGKLAGRKKVHFRLPQSDCTIHSETTHI